MLTKVSYNVVIERFKAFADGHYLIRRFSHGQIDVTDIVQDNQYPWMHIVPVSMTPSDGAIAYEFDVIFADLPRDKEVPTEYQRESLSDCIRLAEDLISEIKNGGVIFGTEVTLETGTTIEPFIEEYTHTLTGVNCKLSMQFPNDWSACEIPADWSAGGTGSGGSGGGGGGVSIVLRTNGTDNPIQTILDLTEGSNMTITDLGDGRVQFDASGDIGATWGTITGVLANQTDLQNALDLKADITSLAAVATSGDYNDLTNLPSIPVNLDDLDDVNVTGAIANNVLLFNGTNWVDQMLADVAYSGEFNDLKTKPALDDISNVNAPSPSDGQVLSYNSTSGEWEAATPSVDGYVPYTGASSNVNLGDNKLITDNGDNNSNVAPSYFSVSNAAATKSSYIDMTGVTVTDSGAGDVMNMNAGGLTFPDASSQYTAAVNADWNATSGLAEILNKPTIPAVIGDMTKAVYDTDNDGIVDFAEALKTEVRNSTGSTLYKGHIVYLSGSTGNLPNAVLAQANNDANSAQTFGVVFADIANNSDGYVITIGQIDTLDTRAVAPNAFTSDTLVDGDVVYLSPTTAGHITRVKPSAPQHIVYVGMVIRTSPTNGTIQYRVQNGYELDEIHDVVATSPVDNDYLYYDSSTSLYRLRQLTAARITDSNTVGQNLLKLTNPNAISYLRVNADNSVSALTLSQLKSDLGLNRTVLASDVSITATNTTLADITGLSFALVAGNTYKFRAELYVTASPVNVGSKFAVNANVSVSSIVYRTTGASGVATGNFVHNAFALDSASTANVGSVLSSQFVVIEGLVSASNNGTLIMRFGKGSANAGTLTIKANSIIDFQTI